MDGTDGAYPAANAAIEIYYRGRYYTPKNAYFTGGVPTDGYVAAFWLTVNQLMLAGF